MSSLKIIVMGVGGVGKSAITNRFVLGRWIEKVSSMHIDIFANEPMHVKAWYDHTIIKQYDPTVEESYRSTIDVDGRALQVEILDTAGQEEVGTLICYSGTCGSIITSMLP
jgi:GTPase SAR1 family protein